MPLDNLPLDSCVHSSQFKTLIEELSNRLSIKVISDLDKIITTGNENELLEFTIDFLDYCRYNPNQNSNNNSTELDRLITYIITKKEENKYMKFLFLMINLIYSTNIFGRDNIYHPQEEKVFYIFHYKSLNIALIDKNIVERIQEGEQIIDDYLLESGDIEIIHTFS